MDISFDPVKREKTLQERQLDFADAGKVFDGPTASRLDDRKEYGEDRITTGGFLNGRFVVIVWTKRGNARHIISMRYGHAKEQARYRPRG